MGQYRCCLSKTLLNLGIAALILGAVDGASGQSATVTLAWNRNLDRDIAGYRLYYGTAPHTFTERIDVGNTVIATVSDLLGGNVYYFAVTAYNTAGVESLFSNGVT